MSRRGSWLEKGSAPVGNRRESTAFSTIGRKPTKDISVFGGAALPGGDGPVAGGAPHVDPPVLCLHRSPDLPAVEQRFRDEHLHRTVAIPYDEQLAATLDAGHYTLDGLRRPTRLAIKQLGLAVAEQLG